MEELQTPERAPEFSPAQLARMFRVHPVTVYRWLKGGKLLGRKAGRRWSVGLGEVERFARESGRSVTVEVQLRVQWPITRATVGHEHPHPEWEAVEDAFVWITALRLQFERLMASFSAEFPRILQKPDDQRKVSAQVTIDEHFLVVAGHHMFKALERAARYFEQLSVDGREGRLKILRNLYEHWDEQRPVFRSADAERKRAAVDFEKLVPGGQPWAVKYYPDDAILADKVSVKSVLKDLEGVEQQLESLRLDLRAANKHLPQGVSPDSVPEGDGPFLRLGPTRS